MRAITIGLVLSSIVASASGGTIVVTPGQSIQAAIDVAIGGDVIQVEPGFYHEAIDYKGKGIRLQSTGGEAVTVISASGLDADVVTLKTNEGPNSILSGFTITGTTGYHNGIRCDHANPRIEYCRIWGNGSVNNDGGGGIDATGVSAGSTEPMVISNCEISSNRGSIGGGIACRDAKRLVIEDCLIKLNTADQVGGGLFLQLDPVGATNSITVDRTIISENLSHGIAGGAWSQSAGPMAIRWTSCVFAGNRGSVYGGAMALNVSGSGDVPTVIRGCVFFKNWSHSACAMQCSLYDAQTGRGTLRIVNCTFVDNYVTPQSALKPAIQVSINDTSVLEVWNSILRSFPGPQLSTNVGAMATVDVSHCNVLGGMAGTANFDADPLFVDRAGGDLHLTALSPCRNVGDSVLAASASPFDFEGDPRIAESVPDVGADEFHPRLYFKGWFTAGSTSHVRVIGPPSAVRVLYLASLTAAPSPIATPYGPFALGFPLIPAFPIDLGAMPANGLIDLPVIVPPGLSGITLYNQAFVGAPALQLTALAPLTLP